MSSASSRTTYQPERSERLEHLRVIAEAEHRSINGQLNYIVEDWFRRAGKTRLEELEALAAAGVARANAPSPGNQAGKDHLAEHRKMCGFDPESAE